MLKTARIIKDCRIRIAMVGCGHIANNHLNAIENHREYLELVGVCDSNPATLQHAVEQRPVAGYRAIDELLEKANPDIVTLCTPSGLHARQTVQIARSGKHVITEKPMATCWADALEMVRVCDEAAVRLFVVKQIRYNPILRLLKQAIVQNRFGQIYLVNLNVFWTRPQSYYDQAKWRGTRELDGGAFMNQAIHYVDLLDWLFGPVQSVQAIMGTLARKIEVEDTGVLNIHWRSGAIGSMNVTMLTYLQNLEGSITVLGEKGTVKIGGISTNEIQHWEFLDKQPEDDEIVTVGRAMEGSGHIHYYGNVIKTLRGEAEPQVDGREGLKSLEIITAAYLSAREHRTVFLPLKYQ